MPSPFPGMDPYLEQPAFFPDLHASLIAYLRETIQTLLPRPYLAKINTRVWVDYTKRSFEPDVDIVRGSGPSGPSREVGTVGVPIAIRPVTVYVANDETSETFIEIYTTQTEWLLVTAVEVLSPSNKTNGERGRDMYVAKQQDLLLRRVNLVEIDLLRKGMHTTAVPLNETLAATGKFDYHVCIRAIEELQQFLVYPIKLTQALPEISVPLLPGDAPIRVNFQAVFDRAYDAGGYQYEPPYTEFPPEPPLTDEQAKWAKELLQAKGLLAP